jgi:hypothetical protein
MLQALKGQPRRWQANQVIPFPAPFGGWNARDDITDMPPQDAVVLDNLIPGDGSVSLRNGYASHGTGMTNAIASLMPYHAPSGTPQLFAATATTVWDVSAAGTATSEFASQTNGDWSHLMFATSGGNFLVMCNGADAVRNYDGASWTTPSITGVTGTTLVSVMAHQSRLWFIQEDTMKVWYLPTLSIAGAATAIDFAGLSRLGGSLWAMASWTRDSGDGIEDLAVFITSRGEVHVYSGSDPSSSATWSRVGTFRIAEPIGRKCTIKVGGDVGILTTQGLVPLSGVLDKAQSAQGQAAITDKIRDAFNRAYSAQSTSSGWAIQEYPLGKLLLINVPVADQSNYVQFVMNVQTGQWCRFTGLNAYSWGLYNNELYFGGLDGVVYKYTGTGDAGGDITAKSVSAFATLGSPSYKYVRRILPLFFGPTGYRPQVGLRFDYAEEEVLSEASNAQTAGDLWDLEDWDAGDWAPADSPNSTWQSLSGKGYAISVVTVIQSQEPIAYHGSKLEIEVGGHL